MNTLLDSPVLAMPDIQSSLDNRKIAIQKVGVRGVRHPLVLGVPGQEPQTTVATWELTVALPAHEKGTHMSRFIALLEDYRGQPMNPAVLTQMAQLMLQNLQAKAGELQADFTYFIEKTAPVSGVRSLLDYQVRWAVRAREGQEPDFITQVLVPVTSLCPCSRAISEYGAHNQRSHVSVRLCTRGAPQFDLDALIAGVEAQASCELWGLLKRADEKFVTEKAYENPRFVEDLVRDVALMLADLPSVESYRVSAENFESIHNHSAYAVVSSE